MSKNINAIDTTNLSPEELQNFHQGIKDNFKHSGQGETHQTTNLTTLETKFDSIKKRN